VALRVVVFQSQWPALLSLCTRGSIQGPATEAPSTETAICSQLANRRVFGQSL